MHALLQDLSSLRLQEDAKQNRHKLSYYVPLDVNLKNLLGEIEKRLHDIDVRTNLIWSVDEPAQTGLLDVLPASASKLHAIEFLIKRKGFSHSDTLFAGDSGNDLSVLTSGIPSVLVANAATEVREQALRQAEQSGTQDNLYLAYGDFHGMNGNYAAGILEGLAHYRAETVDWWS